MQTNKFDNWVLMIIKYYEPNYFKNTLSQKLQTEIFKPKYWIQKSLEYQYEFSLPFILGDHTTGVWVGGSDNGHIGKWAWFPTGKM